MPSDKVAAWIKDFGLAGHVVTGKWACSKCGTTLHDFVKKGRLPCLVADK